MSKNNYQKYFSLIKFLSVLIVFLNGLAIFTKWFVPEFYKLMINDLNYNPNNFTMVQKILGFLVDGFALGLIIVGVLAVIKLMDYFSMEEFFSSNTINLLHTLSKITLVYAIYNIIQGSLLTIITTLKNAPGHRMISLSLGSTDIINIIIFCLIYIIMAILQKGYLIKYEQDLTI